MKKASVSKGFTLIELLVVVVVLGILAAFAYGAFQPYSGTAQTNVDSYVVGTLAGAVATCATLHNGICPGGTTIAELLPTVGGGLSVTGNVSSGGVLRGTDCVVGVSGGVVTAGSNCP